MDVVGLLNVVLFLPRDLSLVEGSPSDRRRFMDGTLRQLDLEYFWRRTNTKRSCPNATLCSGASPKSAPTRSSWILGRAVSG